MQENKPSVFHADLWRSRTYRYVTGCGSAYITISRDADGAIKYISATLGKSGGCARAALQTIAKQTMRTIDAGGSIDKCIEDMLSVDCGRPGFYGAEVTTSCVDGLAQALRRDEQIEKEMIDDGTNRS